MWDPVEVANVSSLLNVLFNWMHLLDEDCADAWNKMQLIEARSDYIQAAGIWIFTVVNVAKFVLSFGNCFSVFWRIRMMYFTNSSLLRS